MRLGSVQEPWEVHSFAIEAVQIKYRPDVDGLRTIAVFSVILYHVKITLGGWQLLPGGYIGVDIFFVISGYLITTLLVTELAQSGRISVLNFYERRARRLLPGLLVVMLASLPLAWKYLLPEQLVDFAKSLVFSLFFTSNFYWHFSLQQYGAESALLQPFLHTWSLAVEEQYYIVFPLLLFAIYKRGRQYLAIILSFIMVLSLLFAQWMTERDASFSFYMMPTRFWELLAGSLLALVALNNFTVNSDSLWQRAMPTLGLLLIVVSMAGFGFDAHHPGFITMIPVVGTVLIICFKRENGWVTRTLSRPTMVYLGLLSYSLYLWHYPIFAFGRMVEIEPSVVHKVAWIILTLFLSAISYHLVEKPFRSKRVSRRVLIFGLFLASSVVIFVSLYWIWGVSTPRHHNYLGEVIESARQVGVRKGEVSCNSGVRPNWYSVSESCVFEYSPESPTLVLVGDSHGAAIAESVRVLAKENHLTYIQVTQMGCPHLRVSDWSNDGTSCFRRAADLRSFLSALERPTIIYSARLPVYLEQVPFDNQESQVQSNNLALRRIRKNLLAAHPDQPSNAVVTTLRSWVDDGYGLVIVYPVPEQGFDVYKTLMRFTPPITRVDQLPTLSTAYDEYKKRVARSYLALDQVVGPGVRRVYPEKIFCREETGKCTASESDRLYFANDSHVAALGSDLIVRQIAEQLDLKAPDSFRK
jgi:peptidoglycan/LPS O-acetylase OafA/YrhL